MNYSKGNVDKKDGLCCPYCKGSYRVSTKCKKCFSPTHKGCAFKDLCWNCVKDKASKEAQQDKEDMDAAVNIPLEREVPKQTPIEQEPELEPNTPSRESNFTFESEKSEVEKEALKCFFQGCNLIVLSCCMVCKSPFCVLHKNMKTVSMCSQKKCSFKLTFGSNWQILNFLKYANNVKAMLTSYA